MLKGFIYEFLRFLRCGVQPKQHFVTLQVLQILITLTGADEALAATRNGIETTFFDIRGLCGHGRGICEQYFSKTLFTYQRNLFERMYLIMEKR